MKKALIAAGVLVLIGGAVTAAALTFGGETEQRGPTYVVRRGDLVETAAATGTIEPYVQVEVKSRASGEVIEVLVEEGATVEAGQLLVRLDPADAERGLREAEVAERRARADLAQAQAQLAVAQAEAAEAGVSLDVSERGAELGVVSQEQRRTASHAARIAASNVALRRAQVQASQAALETARLGVDNARRRLQEMEIRAPIAGTVLSVPIERGSIVSSAVTTVSGGTTLLTLADLSALRVRGSIDEAQIGRVRVGQPVIIRVDAYPDREFQGRVTRVSPLGVQTTNVVTFDVEIAITDEGASLLRSGMSADLEIETGRRSNVLLVPLSAVHSRGGHRFVRLANGEQRRIVTNATDGMRLEVVEGLAEGDVLDLAVRRVEPPPQSGGFPLGGPPRRGGGRPR
jgi:HlyD family secretion protein